MIDLFSQPFFFLVSENKKNKSTYLGRFLSIFVIVASLFYLTYLLVQFFRGEFSPKVQEYNEHNNILM